MEKKEKEEWSYKIIRNVISSEYLNLLDMYFYKRREILKTMLESKYCSAEENVFGAIGDGQPGVKSDTFSIYGDVMTEMLMENLKDFMEKETNMSLVPSYGYMRIYQKGDGLSPHFDRPSCEISTTINISGDMWPIFLKLDEETTIKAELEPGDLLIYKGCEQEHWREEFKGDEAKQVFLHYNNVNGPFGTSNKFDKRPHLGLPPCFIKAEEEEIEKNIEYKIEGGIIKPQSFYN
jgi:hypothetical protein